MGLLKYAAVGALKGGADAYLDLAKEDRADNREQAKEKREQDVWDIRQKRLSEIRAAETESDQAYTSKEAEKTRDFQANEGLLKRNAEADAAKAKGYSLSQGQKHFVNNVEVASVDPKTTGDSDRKKSEDMLKRSKFYEDMANRRLKDSEWGMSEQSGVMSSRMASIASQLDMKYGKQYDPSTIAFAAYQQIIKNPSADISSIDKDIKEAESQWFGNGEEAVRQLEIEKESAQGGYWNNTPDESLLTGKKPGLLTEGATTPPAAQSSPDDIFSAMKSRVGEGFDENEAIRRIKEKYPEWTGPAKQPMKPQVKQEAKPEQKKSNTNIMGVDTSNKANQKKSNSLQESNNQDVFTSGIEKKIKALEEQLKKVEGKPGRSNLAAERSIKSKILAYKRALNR